MTGSTKSSVISWAMLVALACACSHPTAEDPSANGPNQVPLAPAVSANPDNDSSRSEAFAHLKLKPEPKNDLSAMVRKTGRAITLSVSGAELLSTNDRADLVAVLPNPDSPNELMAMTILEDLVVMKVGEQVPSSSDDLLPLTRVSFLVLPEESEMASLAANLTNMRVTLRNQKDKSTLEEKTQTTLGSLVTGIRSKALLTKRIESMENRRLCPIVYDAYGNAFQAPSPSPIDHLDRFSEVILEHGRAISVAVRGADAMRDSDYVDLLLNMNDPNSGAWLVFTLLQNVRVLALGPQLKSRPADAAFPLWYLTLQVLPEEAQILALAERAGWLQVSLRHPEDLHLQSEPTPRSMKSLLTGARGRALMMQRTTSICIIRERRPLYEICDRSDQRDSVPVTEARDPHYRLDWW